VSAPNDESIKVKDRRTAAPDTEAPDAASDRAAEGAQAYSDASAGCARKKPLPPIDFATFILSLSTSALVYLGEVPEPESGTERLELPLARQSIDLLGMLQEKTRGNLDPDEEQLLENLLYDLRMKYVARCKAG
jgi:hypothetical protein